MKVIILANDDPTTNTIFQPICEDLRLKVVCIAFSLSLTKSKSFWRGVYEVYNVSGWPYFIYISFWNGVFLIKQYLIWHLPIMKRIFPNFFSLKLWARDHKVDVISSSDFNSREFLAVISNYQPDVIFLRMGQILKQPIIDSTPYGCWCFHSSELPKYRGGSGRVP